MQLREVALGGCMQKGSGSAGASMRQQRTAVLMLVMVGLLNYLDRALPAVLAEPIKRDLALSDTALGFINGLGFLLVYALAGIPIARLADRGLHAPVIGASLALWSAMTAVAGLVTSGWQLAVSRIGVSLGEAGSLPASHAYLTRHFAPQQRALALSTLSLAVPLGNSIGLMAGGMLGRAVGWRGTFLLMGAAGLVLTPMVLLALRRGAVADGDSHPMQQEVDVGVRSGFFDAMRQPGFALILAGAAFVAIGGYSSIAFVPAFLMRVHGLPLDAVGMKFGLAAGAMGVAALLVTGWWSGRVIARGAKSPLAVVIAMIMIVLPFCAAAFCVASPGWALAMAAIGSVVPVAYLAPVVVTLHGLVPASRRAQASALLLLCTALVGGLGPLAVGMVSDALHASQGAASLGTAMLIVPAAYAGAAGLFSLAARRLQ